MMEHLREFFVFNANNIMLTAVVAVVFYVVHEACAWLHTKIKGK